MIHPLRIYVASSWRNEQQQGVVTALRSEGYEVYDFKNPSPDNHGFHWSDAGDFKDGGPEYYMSHIETNTVAMRGFDFDKAALDWCNVCVLVLPCGRSAHLKAGYACGQGKRVVFMLSHDKWEPELMYLLGDGFCLDTTNLLVMLRNMAYRGLRNSTTTYGFKSTS